MTDLAVQIAEALNTRDARIRQGKVTSIQAGPPRTLTIDISGVSYPGIKCMDHLVPVVGEGIWILDMGIGRWLCFGTSSNTDVTPDTRYVNTAGDAMTGSLTMDIPADPHQVRLKSDTPPYLSFQVNGLVNNNPGGGGSPYTGYIQGSISGGIYINSYGPLRLTATTITCNGGLYANVGLRAATVRAYPTPISGCQIILSSDGGGGGNLAELGLLAGANGCIVLVHEPSGEHIFFRGADAQRFIPISASAFIVESSERVKESIEPVSVLDKVLQLGGTKRYRKKIRPQTGNVSVISGQWNGTHDHNCAIDTCDGTSEEPCCIVINDTPEYGLLAEDVYKIFPEAVFLDIDLLPSGIDINQMIAIAIGSVEELSRRVKILEGVK